jgi:hypothetical protein
MTATTTLGVVVQMTPDTYIRPSSSAWAGLSSGNLELVGDTTSGVGLSLTFDSPAALQHLLDAGQVLLGSMLQVQRQNEQEQAWAQHTARTGRPPLRAVKSEGDVRRSHPCFAGSPA